MIWEEIKKDLFYIFCSFLFFFVFLFINNDVKYVQGSENSNFTIGEEPVERCIPRYEDRIFTDTEGNQILRCVKIAVPDNFYYDKSCEELGLKNPEDYPDECVID